MSHKFLCLALSATAALAQPEHPRREPSGCGSTIWDPILSSLPTAPPNFISYWESNDPSTLSCLPQVPQSLTAEFASVYSEYKSWATENSGAIASVVSKCLPTSFGNLARTEPTQPPTLDGGSLPSVLPSSLESWMWLASITPCPTTPSGSTPTPTAFSTEVAAQAA